MSNHLIHPTEQQFNDILKEEGTILVDFFATWCGPCKMLSPELEKLADAYQGKAKVLKIDVDQEQNLAIRYQVQSVPTLLVFKNGELKHRSSGYQPYPALASMLDQNL